jgi:hypothetical protein
VLLSLGLDEGDWAQVEPTSDACIALCEQLYPGFLDFNRDRTLEKKRGKMTLRGNPAVLIYLL